jgi:chromate transport protein ChrA
MTTPSTEPRDEAHPEALAAPAAVSFAEAFRFWLKLGFISFGGPAGQIAIMHTELVERRRWISEKRFLHALNYCMVLPGPEAQQLATYIGWLLHRTWGGIVAGALFVLPSLFILIAMSWVYLRFGDVPLVAGIFFGLKPAVTALVLHAAHRIGSRALKNRWMWGIAAASLRGDLCVRHAVSRHRAGGGADRALRRATLAGGVCPGRRAWGREAGLWTCPDRRSHADTSPRPFLAQPPGQGAGFRAGALAAGDRCAGGCQRPAGHPHADGLVLHQGGAAHLWWRLCCAAPTCTRARWRRTSGSAARR